MALLSFVIIPSRPNSDGTFTIQLKITNVNTTSYVPTKHRVDSEKQFQNGKVVRHPQSARINRDLNVLLGKYEERLSRLTEPRLRACEIKEYLTSEHLHTGRIRDYAEKYIQRLQDNGQTSYAQNMGYTLKTICESLGDNVTFSQINQSALMAYEKFLYKQGGAKRKQSDDCEDEGPDTASPTTVNIRMSHFKALLNAAVAEGVAEYKIFPFRGYKMPQKVIRDICISKAELIRLRDAEFVGTSAKRLDVARDLFMLSFYCAGINLTDLIDATFEKDKDVLTFVRKKTAAKKTGPDTQVSITIQPEARAIIEKYVDRRGHLDMGYKYTNYGDFRSFVTKSLNRIGQQLGFEKKLMYYSARKTFVQLGTELGIPLYILEYAIGQTIKEANNRPIFNYLKVMRQQADLAIRTIIDYLAEPQSEDDSMPLPEWARRGRRE